MGGNDINSESDGGGCVNPYVNGLMHEEIRVAIIVGEERKEGICH